METWEISKRSDFFFSKVPGGQKVCFFGAFGNPSKMKKIITFWHLDDNE